MHRSFRRCAAALAATFVFALHPPAHGAGSVAGTVRCAGDGSPVPFASVVIVGTNHGAVTDRAGRYAIGDAPEGAFRIEVTHVGYFAAVEEIRLAGETVRLDFALHARPYLAGGVTVTSLRADMTPDLRLDEARAREANPRDMGDVLREIPGVDAVRRGALGLDPVVRGLRETEVGMYIDGTRLFASCPGRMDSPLTHFDPSALRSVEVVTGPYALTWGAGNMSAIRAESQSLPPSAPGAVRGRLGAGYDSNLQAWESHAALFGGRESVSYSLSGAWREGDDYHDGNDADVPGSFRSAEIRGKVGFALNGRSHLTLSSGYQDQRDIDYPARPMDAEYLKATHLKGEWRYHKGNGAFRGADASVYFNGTDHAMNNDRKPSSVADPPKEARTASEMATVGGRAAAELRLGGERRLEAGIDAYSALRDARRVIRRRDTGVLLFDDAVWPEARITDAGLFAALREPLGPLSGAASMRVDFVDATADTTSEFFRENRPGGLDSREVNVSGALSLSLPVGDHWVVSAGAGSVARTADALERYADRFPSSKAQNRSEYLGDPEIRPERSDQADVWLRAHYPRFSARLNGFYRVIEDYITIEPTDLPTHLPGSPEPVYAYINGEALFYGADGSMDATLARNLELGVRGAWTWAEDRELDEPVLGIPPLEIDVSLRFERPERGGLFVEAAVHHVEGQTRVAATRGETPTDGYNTADFKAGWRPTAGVDLRLGVLNLTDTYYINHLNGRNPFTGEPLAEPGRIFFGEATYSF